MAWPHACCALGIVFLAASMDASATPQVASSAPPTVIADSSGAHVDSTAASKRTAAAPSPAVLEACKQIDDDDVLRIQADFGTFEGFASRADSSGLFGLKSRNPVAAHAFSGPLEWDRIRTIEVQENSAKKSAVRGALALGAVGLLAGMLSVRLDHTDYPSSNPNVSRVIAPTVIGVAVGGGIGWAVGSSKRFWRQVYP